MKRAWITAWAFWLMLLLPLCAGLAEATDGEAAYYGTIGKRMTVYCEASESAASLGKIEAGTVVDVYKKGRTWTRIGYESGQGYVLTKFVEMVQRKNPFDGPMPGTSKHVAVGYVLTDTLFTPEGYRYPISVSAELDFHSSDQGWAGVFPVSQAGGRREPRRGQATDV